MWYWCDRGGHKDCDQKDVPMYCGHKDQEGHDKWVDFKAANAKARRQLKTGENKTKESMTDNE